MVKYILKKFFIYNAIYILAMILSWMFSDSFIPICLAWFVILFDIGWSIKSKTARIKYIIYMSTFIVVIVLLSVLGNIFGFKTYVSSETENTIFDAIAASIGLGTVAVILFKIIHDCKEKYPAVKWLYVFAIPWSIFAIVVLILIPFGVFI